MNIIKRLSLLLALLVTPLALQAQFDFTTNADNTVTITGYTGSDRVVVIPDRTNGYPVTSIGDGAFFFTPITGISMPGSVTSIGIQAFEACADLASLTFPSGITNIGIAAFNSCRSLREVAIPASVVSIGDYAFVYCTNLTAITVDGANPYYSSAEGVLFNKDQTVLVQFPWGKGGSYAIPATVTNLADEAFGCDGGPYAEPTCVNLTNLFIPDSLANIGDSAFSYCTGLTRVTLAEGVASIGTQAFSSCVSLPSITIPSSVTNIGDAAFWYSGLENVTIPGSVTNLGFGAFGVCTSLTNCILLDGVACIGGSAFNNCSSLISVSVPNSVTSIGSNAFDSCTNLATIAIPQNANVEEYAFYACTSLACVSVCTNLTDSAITAGPTSIGNRAFIYCASLTNVAIPETVTNLGNEVFANCTSLASATIPQDASIGDSAFWGCTNLACITFRTNLTGTPFATSPTSIGNNAFAFCTSLTNVEIPDSVTWLGDCAFTNCINLTQILVSANVNYIQDQAFSGCSSLKGIYFKGNAPGFVPQDIFQNTPYVTVYYLPDTLDWYPTLGDRPTALWLPSIQANAGSIRGPTNPFSFRINWASGQVVVVETSTNLSEANWQPMQTNTLASESDVISDPQGANYPGRFYRVRSLQ